MNGISGSVSNAVQSALLGINRSLAGLNQDAQTLAQSAAGDDLQATSGALLDSLQQQLTIEASARVLSDANQTLGSLIDVRV